MSALDFNCFVLSLRELFSNEYTGYDVFFAQNDADLLCGVIASEHPLREVELGDAVAERSERILQFLTDSNHISVTMGLSGVHSSEADLPEAFRRSRHYAARPFLPVCVAGTLLYGSFSSHTSTQLSPARHRKENPPEHLFLRLYPCIRQHRIILRPPFFLRTVPAAYPASCAARTDPAPGGIHLRVRHFGKTDSRPAGRCQAEIRVPGAYVRYQAEP